MARTALFALAASILLASLSAGLAELAWARAGGGGGFHGGSSGGGSSGGGSGGGGDFMIVYYLFRFWIEFVIRYPAFGIPATIVLLICLWFFYRKGDSIWKNGGAANGDYEAQVQRSESACDLSALVARDPQFDEKAFRTWVGQAFLSVQKDWVKRETKGMRPFCTDGVLERFDILLDLHKRCQIHNLMRDVEVQSIKMRSLRTDQFFDTLEVKISAAAVDYYVQDGTEKVISGRKDSEPFTEYWSFLRRPGTKTKPGKGFQAGQCPNCGAALKISDRGECEYCHALVTSGQFDWVLAEITQTKAVVGKAGAVAGLSALADRDAAFNVQYAEDRASVIFWRLRDAEALGNPTIAEGIATPNFMTNNRKRFMRGDDGTTRFFADPAVGSVDLVEVFSGGDGFDRLGFRIKWSGRKTKATLPAFLPPSFDQADSFDEEFIMVRNETVKTSAELGLAARSCANCGAAETRLSGSKCRNCGTVLNTGAVDWVLDEVKVFAGVRSAESEYEGTRRSREPGADDAVAAAVALMSADGRAKPEEIALVRSFASQQGVSAERLSAIANSVSNRQLPASVRFVRDDQKRAFIFFMLQLAIADGAITSDEEALLLALEAKIGLRGLDVATEIGKARAALAKGG